MALARKVKPCAIVLFAKSPSCDPEWGLAGRRLGELGVPVIVLGDLRGRPHLVTAIGRLRHRLASRFGGATRFQSSIELMV